MFDPGLSVGQILTEEEVHALFECQTTIGIRMSRKNKCIVLMSGSAKKKSYDDVWDGDVLKYIGTDSNRDENGNQTLITGHGNNNKQLRDVWFEVGTERTAIFLFVKKETDKCVYKGRVELIKEPYQDWRDSSRKNKVWVYPLRLADIDYTANENNFLKVQREALSLPIEELYKAAKGKEKDRLPASVSRQHKSSTIVYDRDSKISAYAKARANGKCDLCNAVAPFVDADGNPYLEAHHLIWLSKGGADEIDNLVALCPNCHRKMHSLNLPEDVSALMEKIKCYKNVESIRY